MLLINRCLNSAGAQHFILQSRMQNCICIDSTLLSVNQTTTEAGTINGMTIALVQVNTERIGCNVYILRYTKSWIGIMLFFFVSMSGENNFLKKVSY